jgi:H+/Cl- antiporter ClcA
MRKIRLSLGSINPWVLVAIWFVCVGAHATYYVSTILAHAAEIQEWYARSHRYQLLMFAIVRLPVWLGVLLALLLLRMSPQKAVQQSVRAIAGPQLRLAKEEVDDLDK